VHIMGFTSLGCAGRGKQDICGWNYYGNCDLSKILSIMMYFSGRCILVWCCAPKTMQFVGGWECNIPILVICNANIIYHENK
jgi:hypothetical protein